MRLYNNAFPNPYISGTPEYRATTSTLQDAAGRLRQKQQDSVHKNWMKWSELQGLATDNVEVTTDGRAEKKESDQEIFDRSYSKMLGCGTLYGELERTQLSVDLKNLIMEGSYESWEEFTLKQPPDERLSWVSFTGLHEQCNGLEGKLGLKNTELSELFDTLIMIGDLGKSNFERKKIKGWIKDDCGRDEDGPEDPDEFKKYLIQQGENVLEEFGSYSTLDAAQKKYVRDVISYEPHHGHELHGENGKFAYEALEKLRESDLTEDTKFMLLELSQLVQVFDVAGARGNQDIGGSKLYTESVHKSYVSLFMVQNSFIEHKKLTAEDAYYRQMSDKCIGVGLWPVNKNSSLEKKLTGLLIQHLRIKDSESATQLHEEVRHWNINLQQKLWGVFGCDRQVPNTYNPAILCSINDKYNPGNVSNLECGLQILLKYTDVYQAKNFKNGEQRPINFNPINDISINDSSRKEIANKFSINNLIDQVRKDPNLLDRVDFWRVNDQGKPVVHPSFFQNW